MSETSKGREGEREAGDGYTTHARTVATMMKGRHPSAGDGTEDTLEREAARVIENLLRLLTAQPPESGEPVAWRYRFRRKDRLYGDGQWHWKWGGERPSVPQNFAGPEMEVEVIALYTRPQAAGE